MLASVGSVPGNRGFALEPGALHGRGPGRVSLGGLHVLTRLRQPTHLLASAARNIPIPSPGHRWIHTTESHLSEVPKTVAFTESERTGGGQQLERGNPRVADHGHDLSGDQDESVLELGCETLYL